MASNGTSFQRLALLASDTPRAAEAYDALLNQGDWVPLGEADAAVVLGGDGFMLQVLHDLLAHNASLPVYGLNHGTVGFLMNKAKSTRTIGQRVARARKVAVCPLEMVSRLPYPLSDEVAKVPAE